MKTLDELREELHEHGLDAYFETLAPWAKNALHITLDVQDDADIPVGVSKFGGRPDLPAGVEWFRTEAGTPMTFLAQINFAETVPYDLDSKLPQNGILYLFYDCSDYGIPWGYDPEDSDAWNVFFYDGDTAFLSRREAPEDLGQDYNGGIFGSAKMYFESVMELPSDDSDLLRNLDPPLDRKQIIRYLGRLCTQQSAYVNKLLGHAAPVQNGMELQCEYVTHGIHYWNTEERARGESMGLDQNAARWNLLMQIECNKEIGMIWGDMGALFLWISDEDLAARNFENAWLIPQSY